MINNVSSYLNYQGHGMIERYPRDLSISYVTAHEMRHAVHNDLTALAKKLDVEQDISYKVSISGGRLIALQGKTEADFKKKEAQGLSSLASKEASPSAKDELESYLKVTRLNRLKDSYEERLREIKNVARGKPAPASSKQGGQGARDNNNFILKSESLDKDAGQIITDNTPSDNSVKREMEKLRLRNEIKLIDDRIGDIEDRKILNEMIDESRAGSRGSEAEGRGSEENHTDFIKLRNGISDVVAGSFWFMERGVPGVILIDGAGSAVKAKDTLKELEKTPNNSQIADKINFGSRFLNLKDSSFDDLSKNLSSLGVSSQSLSNKESFNIHKGISSNSDIADVRTGFGSPNGIYKIKAEQTASGHRIASNEFSDPYKSLNLPGNFTINGYTISVTASDSLADIKDKINFGEDINKNGGLDLSEDLNNNGAIDSFFVKGVKSGGVYIGSVSIFEDIDSNRQLDSSEDINNNERLDGGSGRINVTASIERNRLMLTATLQGDKKISLTDTDGILLSLGFFQLDGKGVSVQKEQQLLATGENLNKEPQKAVISVNGIKYERNTNNINDIIPDTAINIKKASDSDITVTISSDIDRALNNIKGFVNSFNNTLKFINDQIASDRMLNKDPAVQNIRKDMVDNAYNEIQSDDGSNRISEIGIEKDKSEKRSFNQVSLTNLLKNLKEHLAAPPSKGGNSIFAGLDEVGITSIENDTMKINEDRLKESLKNNIDGSYKILSGAGGSVTNRLKSQMDSALNPKTGAIKFRKDVISYYIQNQNVVRDFLKDKQTISQTKIEGKSKTTVLSKVA